MLKMLWEKIKEALISVLPVSIIVLIISFTPLASGITADQRIIFIVSAIVLILGIGLFNLGADMSMTPMGEKVGSALMKTNKIWLIVVVCFAMGLFITIAEPDLSVLAGQVSALLDSTLLIVSIGVGVGIFLVLAVLKIILKKDLSLMLMFFYMLMFMLCALLLETGAGNFLALAIDSGGVTTGPITVPFIMALGVGVATTVGGRNSNENSFGLIALCSIGPIVTVLLLGLTIDTDLLSTVSSSMGKEEAYAFPSDIMTVLEEFGTQCKDVIIALGLIVAFFLIIQFIFIKLSKRKLIQIFIGIGYTFLGLVLFLTAATVGFLPIGYEIGSEMANWAQSSGNAAPIVIFGFIIGMVVVLAEPAVHVLTKQVEDVTTGGVSKRAMLIALCAGVGISLGLSMIRIIFDFSILWYVIPGYFISLGLSFFVPKIYSAIAFDSGGVASGPLTSSFILPFAIGVCSVLQEQSLLQDAFGIVAMVAMTPLIAVQLLGFKAVMSKKVATRSRMKKIISADDEQIINFM